jgi:hypothetical protein
MQLLRSTPVSYGANELFSNDSDATELGMTHVLW